MSVKLLMNWDIKPGRDQDYFEFVVREWVPGIHSLGLRPTEAWYTVYSRDKATPQIMTEVIGDELGILRGVLDSAEWQELHQRLTEYVQNYQQKIVHVNGGFQL